jgi:hypothetical protein
MGTTWPIWTPRRRAAVAVMTIWSARDGSARWPGRWRHGPGRGTHRRSCRRQRRHPQWRAAVPRWGQGVANVGAPTVRTRFTPGRRAIFAVNGAAGTPSPFGAYTDTDMSDGWCWPERSDTKTGYDVPQLSSPWTVHRSIRSGAPCPDSCPNGEREWLGIGTN